MNNIYWEKIDKNVFFVSNETGNWNIITEKEFKSKKIYFQNTLQKSDFIDYKAKAFSNSSLHIIVLTNKCNHYCKYCRVINHKTDYSSMKIPVLIKTIDFIFNTPSKNLAIEFQGGEPLLNWKALKIGIEYSYYLNQKMKKNLILSLVSNLSLMDEEKLNYLLKKNVSICTSLDGPRKIHDRQRIYFKSSSYKKAKYWLKKAIKLAAAMGKSKDILPSALMTTTKYSLTIPKEIIDEYYNLGLGGIFIRELSPIGYTKNVWDELGYTPKDFLKFYEKCLDYILKINLNGSLFIERNAAIRLKKLFTLKEPNFLDLRSPCGAVTGQLAYECNGDIYTCDEGRIVASNGDKKFKIGNVFTSTYKDLIKNNITQQCVLYSFLENQIKCRFCAFKHYCGICPVHNWEKSKTLYGSITSNDWCKIQKGIFSIILNKMRNKKYREIFWKWISLNE